MRGDLSDLPAADVCRALARAGATGVLELDAPDGRGTIVYEGGHVVAATSPAPRARIGHRLVHRGHLAADVLDEVLAEQARSGHPHRVGVMLVERGLVDHDAIRNVVLEQVVDAVFEVLDWRYGTYRFEPGGFGALDVVPEVPLRLPVDQLLAEVARRRREWHELHRVLPDLEAVPRFPEGGGATPDAAFEADELALLASVDGIRSVRALADDLGFGRFEAARIVYALRRAEVLEIDLPEDEVGRALEEAMQELASGAAPAFDTGDVAPAEARTTDEVPTDAAARDGDAGDGDAADVEVVAGTGVAAEPEVVAEEITPLTDISRLLAELETDVWGGRPEEPSLLPEPDDEDVAAPAPRPAEDPAVEHQDLPEEPPPPAPRAAGEEVSELLRELSNLSGPGDGQEEPLDLDPPQDVAAGPDGSGGASDGPTSGPAPEDEGGDAPRRRRFGRG